MEHFQPSAVANGGLVTAAAAYGMSPLSNNGHGIDLTERHRKRKGQ